MIITVELLLMLLMLLLIGAFAGVIAGLLGVGGGIILVPAFFFAFEFLGYGSVYLMQICLATSLATIVITSIRSVQLHNSKGAVNWQILREWFIGIGFGAIIGVFLASSLSSTILMIIFGVLGFVVGLYLTFGKDHWRLGQVMPTGLTKRILSVILGFMSVLMGIGGGSFGVPLMTLFNIPIHRAIATASGFGVIIALPSVVGFLFLNIPSEFKPPFTIGSVNLIAFIVVILMTFLTTPLGVRAAHAMNPKPLKRLFAIFIIIMALNMLRKAF